MSGLTISGHRKAPILAGSMPGTVDRQPPRVSQMTWIEVGRRGSDRA